MDIDSILFKSIDVWRGASSGTAKRYRCFEALPTTDFDGGFFVQSVDFYKKSDDPKRRAYLDQNFVELFCEQTPIRRSRLYQSLEEAIASFDQDFE